MSPSATAALISRSPAAITPTSTPVVCESCSMELEKDMPSTLSNSQTKDTRAYEHERQRSKKAGDIVKTKGRKEARAAAAAAPPSSAAKPKCSCCRTEKGNRRSPGKRDLRALWDRNEAVAEAGDVVEVSLRSPDLSPVRGSPRASRRKSTEVQLAELVTPRRPRKAKASGDFEVIPHVRSVIVLEDTAGEDPDIEEPWEHIGALDQDDTKAPSYAEMASNNK